MGADKGKVTIYLMRHGQTILNKAGRTQGWCDSVLTREGIEVAVNVGLGLSDVKFKAAYSSDLGRAVKTARIVLKENKTNSNLILNELEDLREVYYGKYEGELEKVKYIDTLKYFKVSSFQEAAQKYDFIKEYVNSCAALDETNEAENYETAIKRAIKAIKDICEENANDGGGNVLVVSHGGIIRMIIDYFEKGLDLWGLDNSSISKISYDDGNYKVECVNDNSYNEKGKAIRASMQ